MKLELFKPGMFPPGMKEDPDGFLWMNEEQRQNWCNFTNRILNEHIETLPVVYGFGVQDGFGWRSDSRDDPTHSARLICIEKIPKKECEHEPYTFESSGAHFLKNPGHGDLMLRKGPCKHCGKLLKASWSAVEDE